MTAITPGAICTCRQTGTILYTVVGKADDDQRWPLSPASRASTLPKVTLFLSGYEKQKEKQNVR